MGNFADNKLLLRLSLIDGFWRMDAENYSLFFGYVSNYYKECGHLSELLSQRILYAEIAEKELAKAFPLFGAFSPDKDTLILVMVFQGYQCSPTLENSFLLRLCMKADEDCTRIIPLLLRLR